MVPRGRYGAGPGRHAVAAETESHGGSRDDRYAFPFGQIGEKLLSVVDIIAGLMIADINAITAENAKIGIGTNLVPSIFDEGHVGAGDWAFGDAFVAAGAFLFVECNDH